MVKNVHFSFTLMFKKYAQSVQPVSSTIYLGKMIKGITSMKNCCPVKLSKNSGH